MIGQLLQLVQLETAGDPMGGLLWPRRSLAKLAAALLEAGIKVSPTTVGKWLKHCGYSLRVNRKSLSRPSPPGRDEQFKHIAALREHCERAGLPIISVDTKKRYYRKNNNLWPRAAKLFTITPIPRKTFVKLRCAILPVPVTVGTIAVKSLLPVYNAPPFSRH